MDPELKVRIERDHVVADCGSHLLLLDTGSPTSFGTAEISWRGEPVDLRQGMAVFPLETINESIGLPFDGLIGADLLLADPCRFDVSAGVWRWGVEADGGDGCPCSQLMHVPVAQIECDGVLRPFAVDTGASRTYVEPAIAEGMERVGTVEDFYPGMGTFTSDVIELSVLVAGQRVQLSAGVLPESLGFLMSTFGIEGIIGLDVLGTGSFHFDPAAEMLSPLVSIGTCCSGEE